MGHVKRAVLIDTAKGRAAKITSVPLGSGRPLAIWTVTSIDEARARLRSLRGRSAILRTGHCVVDTATGRALTVMVTVAGAEVPPAPVAV